MQPHYLIAIEGRQEVVMTKKTIKAMTVVVNVPAIIAVAAIISGSFANAQPDESHYLAQYSASSEMILPPNNIWRTWVFVGAPLTPNALNNGAASFPEYHNV
jgi:hypothetical protein